jgi:hypothetical protein
VTAEYGVPAVPAGRAVGPSSSAQCANLFVTCVIVAVPLVPEVAVMSFETATDCTGEKNTDCVGTDGGLVTASCPKVVPNRQFSIGASGQYASVTPVNPVSAELPSESSSRLAMTADDADTV